jgi:hypothetical protein
MKRAFATSPFLQSVRNELKTTCCVRARVKGVKIGDDHTCVLLSGDDHPQPFATTLRSGPELSELLDFADQENPALPGSAARVERSFRTLLEELYLLIPDAEAKAYGLLPFRGAELAQSQPKLMAMVDACFVDHDTAHEPPPLWQFLDYINRHGLREILPPLQKPQDTDLVYSDDGAILDTFGLLRLGSDDTLGYSPSLVLRLRKEVSLLWLTDFLQFSREAKTIIKQALPHWRTLPEGLDRFTIRLPASKHDQTAEAVELRLARLHYRQAMEQLLARREPFCRTMLGTPF